jgi:hypothetical protein
MSGKAGYGRNVSGTVTMLLEDELELRMLVEDVVFKELVELFD